MEQPVDPDPPARFIFPKPSIVKSIRLSVSLLISKVDASMLIEY